MINRLEKELRKLKGSSNSDKGGKKVSNPGSSDPGNYGSGNNSSDNNSRKDERDEKISQLEAKIDQLKNNKSLLP